MIDGLAGPISSRTVAFPSKVVRSHKNSNPLGSAHVPAPCSQCRQLPTPHLPTLSYRGSKTMARPGSAPSPAERAGRFRGGRRPKAAKGGAAP